MTEDDEADNILDAAMFATVSIVGEDVAGPDSEDMDDLVAFGRGSARVTEEDR